MYNSNLMQSAAGYRSNKSRNDSLYLPTQEISRMYVPVSLPSYNTGKSNLHHQDQQISKGNLEKLLLPTKTDRILASIEAARQSTEYKPAALAYIPFALYTPPIESDMRRKHYK